VLAAPVESVLDHALADEPNRRYPTATAFVDALRAALLVDPAPTQVARTRQRLLPLPTSPGARPAAPPAVPARHKQRSRLWRVTAFLLLALAIAAPATAGGLVLGRRIARAQPVQPPPPAVVTHCAVSPFGADANLVVSGVGAIHFCRSQARALSTQGESWAYRAGTHLVAPDSGDPGNLSRLCAFARGRLTAAVYDDLGRRIGTGLCHAFAASGWELRS
jgi:hypothetical protein